MEALIRFLHAEYPTAMTTEIAAAAGVPPQVVLTCLKRDRSADVAEYNARPRGIGFDPKFVAIMRRRIQPRLVSNRNPAASM